MSEAVREQTEQPEKIDNTIYPFVVPVKFHNSTRPYSFGTDMEGLAQGDKVIVETAQGVELGECQAVPLSTEKFPPRMPLKPVLRRATSLDREAHERNFKLAEEAFKICEEEIAALDLKMNLQSADYTLDRSKILFIYVADQRVDFRELLRRLNARLHCKIELRQIGERDKARMVGGIGMCGMECCCSRFKNHFDVISINMAKNQLLALNIEKLSGMCGKLMCCLKYEDDDYKILTEGLPKMGAHVEYEGEMYRVTSMNVMTNEARIENAETFQIITIDDLKTKAEVRKGVTLAKRGSRAPKQVIRNTAHPNQPAERASKPEELSPAELSFAASPAFKAREQSANRPARPVKERKQEKPQNGEKRQANAQQKKNANSQQANNRSRRNQNQNRQPNKLKEEARNNPNVTVRSFKSSRTRAAEAKGETK